MSLEVLAAFLNLVYWQPFMIVGAIFGCFSLVFALFEATRRVFSKSN